MESSGVFPSESALKAMVISVSSDDRKIALSVKALEDGVSKEEYEQKASSGPATFGDLLKAAADDKNEG